MSTELAVVIPSRGRPESVERTATAFADTGADEVAIVYAVERDDPTLDGYLAAVNEWLLFGEVHVVDAGHMAGAINDASRHVIGDLDPYAIAVLNDDHVPRTPGWHEAIVAALRELDPVGLVYPDDGFRGAKLATCWAVQAAWVESLNRMVPARVEHLYTDNAVMNLASALGRMAYLDGVLIEHMHPLAGKGETDPGYQRVNSREQHTRDRTAYRVWENSDKRRRQLDALRLVGAPR